MRQLRVFAQSRRGAVPLMVAATLSAAGACDEPDAPDPGTGGSATTAGSAGQTALGGAAGAAGASQNGGAAGSIFIPPFDAGSAGSSSTEGCDEYVVELPDEGVPAEPGQICAATALPVESHRAARVVLTPSSDPLHVEGTIEIAGLVRDFVTGTPVVEVLDATDERLKAITVSDLTEVPAGFTFTASFPEGIPLTEQLTRMTLRVTFEVECQPEPVTVHAVTDVHLCSESYTESTWVSSGDSCSVCRIIAEMAPSPIVPDQHEDELPLARALRLRVVELARISNKVVLLAENDGGPGLEYEWHASVGTLQRLSPDVVVWTLEEGMASPFIQAAVYAEDAAAVATYSFNAEAA